MTRVLTIAAGTGRRDYCYAIHGELAVEPLGGSCPNPDCGCDRAFIGLASHKASTTVTVTDLDYTEADVVEACRTYLTTAGWDEHLEDADATANQLAANMMRLAERFPVGTLLWAVRGLPTLGGDLGCN